VLRMKQNGKAIALYPDDCQFCFLCVFDCAAQAISITIPRLAQEPRWWEHWSTQG
jgi:NAD-dependent dihydropyrimidine dehydrogenase PreA subunit